MTMLRTVGGRVLRIGTRFAARVSDNAAPVAPVPYPSTSLLPSATLYPKEST